MKSNPYRIAIISFNHPESSLPLAKHLADLSNIVDYYFVTVLRTNSSSAFDFGMKVVRPGIIRLSCRNNQKLFKYLNSSFISISLISLFTYSRTIFLDKILIKLVCRNIQKRNYDIINIIGQHDYLRFFHQNLTLSTKFHTLHEINAHYDTQKISNRLLDYIIGNRIPVIVHSKESLKNFINLSNKVLTNYCIREIPFGLFETYSLFNSNCLVNNYSKYILWYGYIKPYKGLEILKDVSNFLSDKHIDVKIIIAGSGYLPILEELRLDPRFIIINRHLSNEDIVTLNRNALFVVCPYTSASQSGIIPTSFNFQKPIVATNVGALKEFIEDGVNGFVVPANDPEMFAEKIELLLSNRKLLERLCLGTLKYSISYNWQIIAQQTFSFFRSQLHN
jgi:glycosyltransferase involved in cell wall biosynthesis